MALIVVAGEDRKLLPHWSEMLQTAGHDCFVAPPSLQGHGLHRDADLCLYDLGPRGGMDPISLLEALTAHPRVRFVAMSARPDAQEGLQLLRAGVRGYCNRLASLEVIKALISAVGSGEIWAGRQVTEFLLGRALEQEASSSVDEVGLLDRLTAREAELAEQVAAGLSNKVIAIDNGISERTVKAHLNSIFRKTGIRNRVQLALAVSQDSDWPRRLSNA